MGAWALEFDPGMTGQLYQMHCWKGDLWGFCRDGGGHGVWRRTPPNWTQVLASTSDARGEIWDDQMFWGSGSGGFGSRYIYRSLDGLAWVQDHDFGAGAYSHWSAMGGYGNYLYMAMQGFHGAANTTVYRRDTLGNYVATPPVVPDNTHGYDIIGFGGYVYWCDGTDCYEYDVAWGLQADLTNNCHWFTYNPGDGCLYAMRYNSAATTWEVWRRSVAGAWALDHDFGLGAVWLMGAISVGDDGNLYVAAEDGVDSRVYIRSGGTWALHSTALGAIFRSIIAYDDGFYAGTNSCEFWAYTYEYGAGVGTGLPNQALDCDGDGDAIYVCVYDGAGQPVLVKADLPLTQAAVGDAVFEPGAGDAINVKCATVGQRLAVSGYFGNNDQVEVSKDAGAIFTDIDPGTWGAERAQPHLIDPDTVDEVYVALEALQDLYETPDGGTTWTQRQAAVGYSPGALARLPDGDELVVGDDAANVIDYSPNRGQELHDITGAFVGNVAALQVI